MIILIYFIKRNLEKKIMERWVVNYEKEKRIVKYFLFNN